jgi:hypothetical protein
MFARVIPQVSIHARTRADRKPPVPAAAPRVLQEHLDLGPPVAPIAPESDVRQASIARCLAHPGEFDAEDLGDLLRGEQAILAHRPPTSLPQAVHPARGTPRANSSHLQRCG